MTRTRLVSATAALLLPLAIACGHGSTPPDDDPMMSHQPSFAAAGADAAAQEAEDAVMALMGNVNAALQAGGAPYQVAIAEWLGESQGRTLVFRDIGNKQITADFVPGDTRRHDGSNITYTIDEKEGVVDGLTQAQTDGAIDAAMGTWDSQTCSTLPIAKVQSPANVDIGVVEFLNGLGGSLDVVADVTHAGWLPTGILPNQVIASTFTFVFISAPNVPTDIDGDGKADVAFREILYNNRFLWRVNNNVDIETVALHESGHGLSQAHFGKAFITDRNDFLHFAPRAVMNAAYSGIQHELTGTDNAGHCSIWGSWPSN